MFKDCVLNLARALLALIHLLLVGVLTYEAINVHVDVEGQSADLEQVDQDVLWRASLVKYHDVLDKVQVKIGALFFAPFLSNLEQKNCLTTVEVEAEDAVD